MRARRLEKTRQIVEGAEVVLDLGGVNLNDITTAGYSARLDTARFIWVGSTMYVSESKYSAACASLICSGNLQS